MAKKKGLLGMAAAFAASPQGRRLIQQGKEYAQKPENRAKAQQVINQLRNRGQKSGTVKGETVTPPPVRPETPPR